MSGSDDPTRVRFGGRVAVVTGGGGGIGAGIARRFAAEEATVAILDVDQEGMAAAVDAITAAGGVAFAVEADVTARASVERAIQAVRERAGPVDVLVNNAGITLPGPFPEMSLSQWKRVIEVNLKGYFLLAQAVAAEMRERRSGSIVNIASIAALGGPLGRVNYAASKAGVLGLTRALALELAPYGVTVNAVGPGAVTTPMTLRAQSPERWEAVRKVTPLGRIGTPDDIASAVLFLASDEASYITGQCLYVCGGRSLTGAVP